MSLRAICDYQRIFALRAARREDCLTADVPTSAAPKSSLCIDREARKDGPKLPFVKPAANDRGEPNVTDAALVMNVRIQ